MRFKRFFCSLTALVLSAVLLCPDAAAAAPTKSADVITAALNEVGYTETSREYTKYGAWYGLPNSYWCDMFVSWCAMKGGIPSSRFPRHCSCTSHVGLFSSRDATGSAPPAAAATFPSRGT